MRAEKQENRSRILVAAGRRYRFIVSALQVWKDGALDACDIGGWCASEDPLNPKGAWKDGKRHVFNPVQQKLIQKAEPSRPSPQADWFELIYKIGSGDWSRLPVTLSSGNRGAFTGEVMAEISGELIFCANDLASRWDFLDKYDNNRGWIWLEVEGLD